MSLSSIISAYQAAHQSILNDNPNPDGTTGSAPTTRPGSLDTAGAPWCLTTPAEAVWNLQAISYKRQQRTLKVGIWVKPVMAGEGIDDGFQQAVGLLQAFGDFYLANLNLPDSNGVGQIDTTMQLTDSGVSVNTYGQLDILWWYVEFSLVVVEKK